MTVAADGRRFTVYEGRCLCSPCWQARCECGTVLTKHDFTAEEAAAGAREVLASPDPRPGFGHPRCRKGAVPGSR